MNISSKRVLIAGSISLCMLAPHQLLAADPKPVSQATEAGETNQISPQQQGPVDQSRTPRKFETQGMEDAWIQGKVEVALALNRHLNPFAIDTEVKDGVVTLSGEVESDIDRQLAAEITRSIDDVKNVTNNLAVKPEASRREAEAADAPRDWKQEIADITTSAVVKTKLLANSGTEGLAIHVRTDRDIVLLHGEVSSAQEKDLAGLIAENTEGVKEVDNQLQIKGS